MTTPETPETPETTPATTPPEVKVVVPTPAQDIMVQVGLAALRKAAEDIVSKINHTVTAVEQGKIDINTLHGKLAVLNDLISVGAQAEAENAARAAEAAKAPKPALVDATPATPAEPKPV